MNKIIWIVIILAVIIVALIGVLLFMPAKNNTPVSTAGIQVNSPTANAEVSSPLKIIGQVRGNGWSGFEGQVGSVRLIDGNGTEIISGPLTATTEWTKLPTDFETTLKFDGAPGNATLVFHNENPSGLPQNDKTFILPVKISQNKTISLGVFFGNQSLSSSSEQDVCKRVYRSNRNVGETTAVAQAAINELLKGPTDAEKAAGFFTSIPSGSKLNSISIVNGEARADFNQITQSGGGSCSMSSRVAQITQTLLQFPTITSVRLSVNGQTTAIFQP